MSENLSEKLNRAAQLRQEESLQESLDLYNQILAADPEHTEALIGKGLTLLDMGIRINDLEQYQPFSYFEKAYETGQDKISVLLEHIKALMHTRAVRHNLKVIEICDRILMSDRHNIPAHVYKMTALYRAEKQAESILIADSLIRAGQAMFDAYKYKGWNLFDLQRYEEAVQCFEESYKFGTAEINMLAFEGLMLTRLNKLAAAIDVLDRAIGMDASYTKAWTFKIDVLEKLGMKKEAKECLARMPYEPIDNM